MKIGSQGWALPGTQQPMTDSFAADPRLGMPEAHLQNAITQLAFNLGWQSYHTFNSRRSREGFPDLVLWHPVAHRTLFVELKDHKRQVTQTQESCLVTLHQAGNEVYVWRPADWITGRVEELLRVRP